MKNLLKFNYLFCLMLAVTTLSSCSKDDDIPSGDKSKLIGEWSVTGIYLDGENIMEDELGGEENYVEFDEVKQIFGTTHNGDGRFMARFNYYYNGYTTSMPFGSWKMTSSSIVRINNEYDLKIKKSTATELIFDMEDDEMGWVEVRCVK